MHLFKTAFIVNGNPPKKALCSRRQSRAKVEVLVTFEVIFFRKIFLFSNSELNKKHYISKLQVSKIFSKYEILKFKIK